MTTRVLICDDSSLARKQMARALPKNWNAEVTFAFDGRNALEKLRAGAGELLFLDLNMPEMDGYEVLDAIRKEDLPVLTIVVSGDIQPEARARVRKLGAIEFIKKPTDTDLVLKLLQDYGFLRPEDLVEEHEQSAASDTTNTTSTSAPISLNDYLQEIANVAMGRSSDLLARLLRVFVKQPIPRVEMIARSELSMAISAAQADSSYSAVCQGFTGAGVAGEALLLFADASFNDMAELLHYEDMDTESIQVEVLMDMSSILFGAFLKGIGDQLDLKLGLGHPTVLGQHRQIGDLLEHHSTRHEKLLCIEISYELEDREISCDMLVLLTEDSVPFLEQRLQYLVD
ncbi:MULTISPECIES: response regulator [Marinobacter]|jgi:chemotaxis protein CheY-P-specific phosphatase CheC|uniref:Chemotaxis protein CheC n=1 Tax=Marinobacter salarius TaxID=1420917 RepID=W5YVJ8_9GAMM|nr:MULTISPECIES: response regulator [Marinobacter]AHI30498.1 chemotaxis protein CheC [Marinobacter salarius]KXJ44728.1 MAG: chemotaxis protein CheC [Marinobacter sp. Hex_13]OLF82135.1 chemotaxis protein CheC [Marinobacter sp. C18]SFL41279.1 DNA-binding transcriptional response regulator, NtrC family, contains REC, AAA-type ATPase, and a Fis-type DNA-binding domains [Marinobacter salarius]|tara:strand:+ start:1758 stop:2786 length:1029 start_codon:yes stop_codon:yes gene_type:complete